MNFKLLTILLISLVFIASCSEDKEKVSSFVGNYVITEATVAESFNVPVTGIGRYPCSRWNTNYCCNSDSIIKCCFLLICR